MSDKITNIFKAIADPTRREIFHVLLLAATALPITQISSQVDMSRQGVTKHLKILEGAGLIHIHTHGRERFCQADAKPLQEISGWLKFYEQFWDQSLDNLTNYLDSKS